MALPKKVMNAILWYAKQNDLTPQLSVYPDLYFKDSKGETVKVPAMNLLAQYDGRGRKK